MALPVHYFLIELQLGMLVFVERGKTGGSREKPLGARTTTKKF